MYSFESCNIVTTRFTGFKKRGVIMMGVIMMGPALLAHMSKTKTTLLKKNFFPFSLHMICMELMKIYIKVLDKC